MARQYELVPEGRVDESRGEKLTHNLGRVDDVGVALVPIAIHEIRVYEDAGFLESRAGRDEVLEVDALVDGLEPRRRRDLYAAGHADEAARGQVPREVAREGLLEADVPPKRKRIARSRVPVSEVPQGAGRSGLVDEMHAANSLRLGLRGETRVKRGDVDRKISLYIVEGNVAERASVPIAAVREIGFHPGAVRPKPMHRIRRVGETGIEREIDIAIVRNETRGIRVLERAKLGRALDTDWRDAGDIARGALSFAPGGYAFAAPFPQEKGRVPAIAAIKRQMIEKREKARVIARAQFRVHVAAAHADDRARAKGSANRAREAQGPDEAARERD